MLFMMENQSIHFLKESIHLINYILERSVNHGKVERIS